jgi:hypothetical protein
MSHRHSHRLSVVTLIGVASMAAAATVATAQIVTPKTVPVHQSQQFAIPPSALSGMGSTTLALHDTLQDPFINPATASRVRRSLVFASPYRHAISNRRGGGVTLPIGIVARHGVWSGGALVAVQSSDRAGPAAWSGASRQTVDNSFLSASIARRAGDVLTFGASATRASLLAIDGVDLLYQGSDRIEQRGSLDDYRLAAIAGWSDGRELELMLVHARTDMEHNVHFPTFPVFDTSTWVQIGTQPERDEHNVDRTRIWGLHTVYAQPVGGGWRLGAIATANRLSHPKIPNYQIMNIPRDPGTTYAFNTGIGAAHRDGSRTVAIDIVYEPMWSHTWADAERDTVGGAGRIIRAGSATIENRFRFTNRHLRLGVSHHPVPTSDSTGSWGFQYGIRFHTIQYRLRQANHVQGTTRTQRERWTEWTPSAAVRYMSSNVTIRFETSLTCGTGNCIELLRTDDVVTAPPQPGGIIAAPSQRIRLESGGVWVHRLSLSFPLN